MRNPGAASLRLEIEVAWEPRLQPITLALPMAQWSAVDDRGQAVAIERPDAELEVPLERGPIAKSVQILLAPPPRSASRIARLAGALDVLVPGKLETFRFQDLEKAANVEQRTAGATVILEEVMKNNELWEVFVRLRFDRARRALASHRTWVFENPAHLEAPGGKRIAYSSLENTRQTEDEVGMGYLFSVPGKLADYTFVYQTPGAIFAVPLRFEFENIPLP